MLQHYNYFQPALHLLCTTLRYSDDLLSYNKHLLYFCYQNLVTNQLCYSVIIQHIACGLISYQICYMILQNERFVKHWIDRNIRFCSAYKLEVQAEHM